MTPLELLGLRRAARITQAELAKRLGYSRKTIVNWEREVFSIPTGETQAIIAACSKPAPITAVDRKDALETLAMYRKCRVLWSHAESVDYLQKQNVVFTPMAMEMIAQAFPDILNQTSKG